MKDYATMFLGRSTPPPVPFLPPPQFFRPSFPFPLEALGNMTPPMSEVVLLFKKKLALFMFSERKLP